MNKRYVFSLIFLIAADILAITLAIVALSQKAAGKEPENQNTVEEPVVEHTPAPIYSEIEIKEVCAAVPVEEPEEVIIETKEPSETVAPEIPYSDDIPLDYDLQLALQNACKEFSVPYALALGLIERETHFKNVIGDNGNSYGYMQVQPRWHGGRMERLGVTDLMDPVGNFRVGLDFLSEQYDIFGDLGMALTVYNMGHYPGYVTNYARDVMANYESWLEVLGFTA